MTSHSIKKRRINKKKVKAVDPVQVDLILNTAQTAAPIEIMKTRDFETKTVREEIDRKKRKTERYERLKHLTWGMGLEHETHIFHMPLHGKEMKKIRDMNRYKIEDFTVFNSFLNTVNLAENHEQYKISLESLDFLEKVPAEPTGRKCNAKDVLAKIPVAMPEFVTSNPFSNLVDGRKTVEYYSEQLKELEEKYILLQHKNYMGFKSAEYFGPLALFPVGMSSFVKVPKPTGKGEFFKKIYEDYLGSYHFTITLPFDKHKTDKKSVERFIDQHRNFANMMQWIEPLLTVGFFSADMRSNGYGQDRVKGSFRVMRVGWGNFAGSDLRKIEEGLGRYANIKANWRKGLDFYELDKLKYCDKVSIKEPGAISALSSDVRTFGSTDPKRPWHRESGAPMTIPNGIELRIFDHFPTEHISELCKLLCYLANNSRHYKCKKYVYEDADWIHALQEIMKHGFLARVGWKYIEKLRQMLDLPLNVSNDRAYHVLSVLNRELHKKNKDGDWSYLLIKDRKEPPKIPMMNEKSISMGIAMKLIKYDVVRDGLINLLKKLPTECSYDLYDQYFPEYLSKEKWNNGREDLLYYLRQKGVVSFMTKKGDIEKIHIHKNRIVELNLFYLNIDIYGSFLDEKERNRVKLIAKMKTRKLSNEDKLTRDYLLRVIKRQQ